MLAIVAKTRSGARYGRSHIRCYTRLAACSITSCPARGLVNMKAPSKSVLQGRSRPIAICHVGTVPVYSVDGQLHQHQREHPDIWSRPYQLRCGVEIRYPFRAHRNTDTGGERQPRRKVAAFPGYYFLMISRFSSGARSNLSAPEPLSPVDRERRALLDHAALCRRVAGEISHTQAAKRLRMMAQEYETRAIRLEGVAREANDNVGASARTAQTCTDVLRTSDWRLQ